MKALENSLKNKNIKYLCEFTIIYNKHYHLYFDSVFIIYLKYINKFFMM